MTRGDRGPRFNPAHCPFFFTTLLRTKCKIMCRKVFKASAKIINSSRGPMVRRRFAEAGIWYLILLWSFPGKLKLKFFYIINFEENGDVWNAKGLKMTRVAPKVAWLVHYTNCRKLRHIKNKSNSQGQVRIWDSATFFGNGSARFRKILLWGIKIS